MSKFLSLAHRAALAGALLAAAPVLVPGLATSARAESASCLEIQKYLLDRKSIAASLAPKKGKQLDARFACAGFGRLVSNGSSLIKWVDANKDWCQIPDSFTTSIKEDHTRAIAIRGKACGVAAQAVKMEQQAKQQGGASAGLLGGGGLEGPTKMPQGAL